MSREPGGASRWGVAAFLSFVYALNYLDRQFLSVLAEPVKASLKLSDTQLGMLTGLMFALFYTAFGLPVAALADRTRRNRVIAAACALWSLATAACGAATSFLGLAAARIAVGVGEAGGSPPAYSLLSDYFPPHSRGRALALYALGVPVGSMLGAASGGWIASRFGWRTAFFALGAIGLIVAPLILLLVREPQRGRLDPHPQGAGATPSWRALLAMFRRPALLATAIGAGLSAFIGYGGQNWAPAFLMREKGMTLQELALWYSLTIGIAGVAGTGLSGLLVDWLGRRRPAAYALVPAAATLLGLPVFWAYLHAQGWVAALVCIAGSSLLLIVYLAPALAVLQNAVPAHQRATAGAFLLFILNLIGLGGGPLYVGRLSDHFRARMGQASLTAGLEGLVPVFVICVLTYLLGAWLLEREAKARA